MTAPSGSSLEIDYYLERVRAALQDLPEDVRDDLMEDLPAHFAEVLEEQGGPLVERLGPPAAYAAELRAAAGLDDGGAQPDARRAAFDARLAQIRARLVVADARAGRVIGYERLSEYVRLLRPAWWIVRGVGVVALLFVLDILPTDRFDDPLGWLVCAVAVVISVRLGVTGRPRMPRWAGLVLTGLAVAGTIAVATNARQLAYQVVDPFQVGGYSYVDRYSNITDVYPVDSHGRPLTGVTLYDQNGNPIVLGDPWRCGGNGEPESDPRTYPMCVRPGAEPSASVSASPSSSPSSSSAPSAAPSVSPSATPSR